MTPSQYLRKKNSSIVINILVSFIQPCTEASKAKMNQEKMNELNQDINSLTSFSISGTSATINSTVLLCAENFKGEYFEIFIFFVT